MDINKENIDYYIEGGKREALRARLLKTMNPETKLPEALRDTYESTEDYIIRSAIDIYKPLMLLVDKVGATDVQKQILKNVVEAILADKKMIVPYSNTEDEKCISYKNIEDQVGIKLNPEAISLLVSFTRTYLYNEVSKEGEGHSIIIATHRIPEHTYFYLGEGGERVEVLSREKADELAEQGYDLGITYCGNEKDYNFIKRPKPEPVYERYVDGQLVSAREITSEAVLKFKELYEEYYLESPIEDGINDIETFKKITSEKYKDDKDGIRSKVFRILLNMEIIKKINPSELTDKQKQCFEEFMKDEIEWNREGLKFFCTPTSLREDEKVKRVSGLKECIDEILENVDRGSIPNMPIKSFSKKTPTSLGLISRFEKILMQAVIDGQITDYDYFTSMKAVDCTKNFLDKVKLPREELLAYILGSEGVAEERTNLQQGKEDIEM